MAVNTYSGGVRLDGCLAWCGVRLVQVPAGALFTAKGAGPMRDLGRGAASLSLESEPTLWSGRCFFPDQTPGDELGSESS